LPFWESALAAAVLEAALVRPSLSTALAAFAALLLVCFLLAVIFEPSTDSQQNLRKVSTRRNGLLQRLEPL
jgi:hypothetical protein